MFGNVITQGDCCGIHGCQRATIDSVAGGDMVAVLNGTASRVSFETKNVAEEFVANFAAQNTEMTVSLAKKDGGLNASFSLMCQTSKGHWEFLSVHEGTLMVVNGVPLLVKRKQK